MASNRQQVSGSRGVNPQPKSIAIKDQAKYHNVMPAKKVRDIINESMVDQTVPKPTQVTESKD